MKRRQIYGFSILAVMALFAITCTGMVGGFRVVIAIAALSIVMGVFGVSLWLIWGGE